MKRDRIQLYLIVLLAGGLLAGCTAGTVEDIVPEESRPVELRFSKPDLGIPVLLSRAGGGGYRSCGICNPAARRGYGAHLRLFAR